MATYQLAEALLDFFAGAATSNLSAHTPDLGGPWAIQAGYTPKLDGVGGCYQPAGVGGGDFKPAALTPATIGEDQVVGLQLKFLDDPGTRDTVAGVVARHTGATTYYALAYNCDTGTWSLTAFVAGVGTGLSAGTFEQATGRELQLQLEVIGDQLTATVNGEVQDVITDASIAGDGAAGFCLNPNGATNASNGTHIRQFLCAGSA